MAFDLFCRFSLTRISQATSEMGEWKSGLSVPRSHYPDKAFGLDFKDATALQFSHSHLVFLSISNDKHQNVPPVNHHQKCLINGICGTSDMKSNCFGLVLPEMLKTF